MPKHKQVTTCLRGGGPLSVYCSCQHCNLAVCEVCGAYEGGLTTDCPGVRVDYDRQKEVYETNLDYTDDRGWHQGDPMKMRTWHFLETKLPPVAPSVDPRTQIATSIDWQLLDHHAALQNELTKKAIAWVLADRLCDQKSADLARVEEVTRQMVATSSAASQKELLEQHGVLEQAKIDFRVADQRAQKADDEFRQVARTIVGSLERPLGRVPDVYPGSK
jgi:hypothetical protein